MVTDYNSRKTVQLFGYVWFIPTNWYSIAFPFQWIRWFAKRFLHPDIVSEYAYIFLWDEDLGVENFDVGR